MPDGDMSPCGTGRPWGEDKTSEGLAPYLPVPPPSASEEGSGLRRAAEQGEKTEMRKPETESMKWGGETRVTHTGRQKKKKKV
jgi:hypothetical protein